MNNLSNIRCNSKFKFIKIMLIIFCVALLLAALTQVFRAKSEAGERVDVATTDNIAVFDKNTTSVYNITVGTSVIGLDSEKWSGTGQYLHYAISDPVQAQFYPSTNTLNINGGTISQYFQYKKVINGKESTFEVTSPVSVNNIDPTCDFATKNNLKQIDKVNINITSNTNIVINQHAYNSDTSNVRDHFYNHCGINTRFINNPCDLYLYGDGNLTFSANINSQCNILHAIESQNFVAGQNSFSKTFGSKINLTSFNAYSNNETFDVSAVGINVSQASFVSAELVVFDASFSSNRRASFIVVNGYNGIRSESVV